MSRAAALLLALTLGLSVVAGGLLARGTRAPGRPEAREFHRLVGGLGFGPAVDLSRCAFSFDRRLCPACPSDTGPVPGGLFFCPHHFVGDQPAR